MENLTAVLVGPTANESEVLSKPEYELVKTILELYRSENNAEAQAILRALDRWCSEPLLSSATKYGGNILTAFLHGLLEELGKHSEDIQGMLTNGDLSEKPIFMREEEAETKFNCLKAFLTLIRANNWLGEFLQLHVPRIAESGSCPTPIEFMQDVRERAAQFDADIANARRMLQGWPRLICSDQDAMNKQPALRPEQSRR